MKAPTTPARLVTRRRFLSTGSVDTLYLTTFTYGRGLAGRQILGHAFPDHGAQESDEKTFHGGNYATPHAEFYRDHRVGQIIRRHEARSACGG